MTNHMIPEAAYRSAEATYTEVLVDLRLREGGRFTVASQQRRAIHAALEAAAPHILAGVRQLHAEASGDYSDHNGQRWTGDHCAHCRDEWPCATIEALPAVE